MGVNSVLIKIDVYTRQSAVLNMIAVRNSGANLRYDGVLIFSSASPDGAIGSKNTICQSSVTVQKEYDAVMD